MPSTRPRADSNEFEPNKQHLLEVGFDLFHFQIDWVHWAYKALAFFVLSLHLALGWWLLSPWSPAWSPAWSPGKSDIISVGQSDFNEYFQTFSGNTECGISLSDLYIPPKKDENGRYPRGSFCTNRETVLEAMTGGGRHGFDAPYFPRSCHYRWYSVAEICMILERFDSLVFVGDDTLRTIYSGLNILLRKDLSLGALNPSSSLSPSELTSCRCENQFIKLTCSQQVLESSDQVSPNTHNPYLCSRIPHSFLPISGSPFTPSTLKSLHSLIPPAPPSNYHPIPVIISLTPPGTPPSTSLATQTLRELLTFTDATLRKTPILWLGPTAAGHLDIRAGSNRVGNNELWTFSSEMERVAREMEVESLGLWNMTVQAESWDGRRFGSKVAVVQAMMVVNWLSRLESS